MNYKKQINTLEGRLKIYKHMLFIYNLCKYLPFMRAFFDVSRGFCIYFVDHNIQMTYLSELLLQKPTNFSGGYWFEPKLLTPRIKCLKKAIDITYDKITERNLSESLKEDLLIH